MAITPIKPTVTPYINNATEKLKELSTLQKRQLAELGKEGAPKKFFTDEEHKRLQQDALGIAEQANDLLQNAIDEQSTPEATQEVADQVIAQLKSDGLSSLQIEGLQKFLATYVQPDARNLPGLEAVRLSAGPDNDPRLVKKTNHKFRMEEYHNAINALSPKNIGSDDPTYQDRAHDNLMRIINKNDSAEVDSLSEVQKLLQQPRYRGPRSTLAQMVPQTENPNQKQNMLGLLGLDKVNAKAAQLLRNRAGATTEDIKNDLREIGKIASQLNLDSPEELNAVGLNQEAVQRLLEKFKPLAQSGEIKFGEDQDIDAALKFLAEASVAHSAPDLTDIDQKVQDTLDDMENNEKGEGKDAVEDPKMPSQYQKAKMLWQLFKAPIPPIPTPKAAWTARTTPGTFNMRQAMGARTKRYMKIGAVGGLISAGYPIELCLAVFMANQSEIHDLRKKELIHEAEAQLEIAKTMEDMHNRDEHARKKAQTTKEGEADNPLAQQQKAEEDELNKYIEEVDKDPSKIRRRPFNPSIEKTTNLKEYKERMRYLQKQGFDVPGLDLNKMVDDPKAAVRAAEANLEKVMSQDVRMLEHQWEKTFELLKNALLTSLSTAESAIQAGKMQ